jgi:hypothetical protein
MTGTLSCTVAALAAFNAGNAVYQIAYPIPEANAPDATAYQNPALSREVRSNMITLNAAAMGTARRKFPAVTWVGSPAPLPRKE